MDCFRCGADNPPTDKYCGQCGRPLEEMSKLQKASEALGWLMMISGTVILALAALYHLIPVAATTDQGWWSVGPLLSSFLAKISFLSGEGYSWPGLTVGALLGVLGILVWAWPRFHTPDRSGKGIKALLLIGGLVISAGAILGAFPSNMWAILTPAGQVPTVAVIGRFEFVYRGVVLTGLTIVLGAAVWASWKGRRWGSPSMAAAEGGGPADGKGSAL